MGHNVKKIFISYSRKSRSAVALLADDLTLLGYSVWFDKDLIGGHKWWDVILENIRFCDVFLFTVTRDSIRATPCQTELAYAQALNKPIIPILLEDDINISLLQTDLQALQFVDYTAPSKESLGKLNRSLISLPNPAPLPQHLPPTPEMPLTIVAEINQRIEQRHLSEQEQTDIWHAIGQLESPQDAEILVGRLKQHPDFSLNIPHTPAQPSPSSATLQLHRQSNYGYSLRAFQVYIDGVRVGDIRNDETLRFPNLSTGNHQLTVKVDMTKTTIPFEIVAGQQTLCFEMRLGGILMNKIIVEQTNC